MAERWPIKIAPSILAGDHGALALESRRMEEAGADAIHIDVMDGHFVPNFSFGPGAVAAIRKETKLFLDVHLMIYNPFDYVERFIEAGANRITFHFEATEDVEDTINYIRRSGAEAGVAFRPETSESLMVKYATLCDAILVMTVNPGFGGQAFLPEMLTKIRFLRDLCDKLRIRKGGVVASDKESLPPFAIQVDGGIDLETARSCFEAGANEFVSGTSLFRAPNMQEMLRQMRDRLK